MTKRALLIGVPGGGLNVGLAIERMRSVLEPIGFEVVTVDGSRATRTGIESALRRSIDRAELGDAWFIYYFGHGGRVRFADLDGELAEHEFGYVSCTPTMRGEFEAILDVELSRRLTELEARCGNVTVMLDCCYSGELVREREVELSAKQVGVAPDWVRPAIAARSELRLALDSHPGIVRLCGSSPQRTAYAVERSGRHIGRLTEAFLATLEAAGAGWERLCWDGITHHLRERVIEAVGNEGQWVALAGPRTRRLFSCEQVELPGLVGALAGAEQGTASLRAGWQQGIAVGDRWAIADLQLSLIAEAEVIEVDRNRSMLRLDRSVELVAGGPACLRKTAAPMPVVAAAGLAAAIDRSPWLRAVTSDGVARVEPHEARVRVTDVDARRSVELDADDHAAIVELLEHWAGHAALLRSLAAHQPDDTPVRWSWSRITEGEHREPLSQTDAQLHAGDRVVFELHNDALFDPWFVSVVLVDPSGRLQLLNTRMPEGLELPGRGKSTLGWRVGGHRQGLELRWPEGLGDVASASASILLLFARRPISLAHIVRPQLLDHDDALALQGLAGDTLRSHQPELARACAWAFARFELRRQPRGSGLSAEASSSR